MSRTIKIIIFLYLVGIKILYIYIVNVIDLIFFINLILFF